MPFSSIKAVILDLDGTLINSWLDIAHSVNYALGELELPEHSIEVIQGFIGNGMGTLINRALGPEQQHNYDSCLRIFRKHYREHCVVNTRLYPGTQETLDQLSEYYPLFVVTNKPAKFSVYIMEKLGIDHYFKMIIGGDTFPVHKPDPVGLLHIAEKYKFPVNTLVMVGDHHVDVETGKNAGCPTIFCQYGMGEIGDSTPDATIRSISELFPLLKP